MVDIDPRGKDLMLSEPTVNSNSLHMGLCSFIPVRVLRMIFILDISAEYRGKCDQIYSHWLLY